MTTNETIARSIHDDELAYFRARYETERAARDAEAAEAAENGGGCEYILFQYPGYAGVYRDVECGDAADFTYQLRGPDGRFMASTTRYCAYHVATIRQLAQQAPRESWLWDWCMEGVWRGKGAVAPYTTAYSAVCIGAWV